MMHTIEDLAEIFATRKETAEFWLQARDDAAADHMTYHLKFVEAAREADVALAELMAAQGEPS